MTELNQDNRSEEKDNGQSLKNYFLFFSGQQISLLGSTVVQFVLIWWVTLETGSELILGLASLAGFGPMVILSPIAGTIADRINRKLVIVISDTVIAIITAVAIYLFYAEKFSITWLFIVLVIRSIGDSFHNTVVVSILPTMVPDKLISRINGLNYLTNAIIRIAGPAIAAGLLILFRTVDLMWADIVSFVIALILIIKVDIPHVETELHKGDKIHMFADLKDAFKTILNTKGLLAIGIMLIVVNLFFTPFSTMLPLFIYKTHGGIETDYALVIFFFQAGIIAGSLFMSIFKGFKKKGWVSYFAIIWTFIILTTIYFIPEGSSNLFWLIGIQFFLGTIVHPVINVSILSSIQLVIPKEKLGRASGLIATEVSNVQPLSMIFAGGFGALIGIRYVYLMSGILGIVICSLIWFLTKARNFDKQLERKLSIGSL
jgi:DHA3 family macrolide efflux protein-like MFS transporter